MRITITRKLPGNFESLLASHFEKVTVLEHGRPLTKQEITEAASQCEVLLCMLTDRIDDEALAKATAMKCLITYSVGVDHVDLRALAKRKIQFAHTPAVLTEATADLAWSLILCCSRRLRPAISYVEKNQFSGFGPELFLGVGMWGATIGIVGMGRIGSAVSKRAAGFGMKILSTSSKGKGVSLEELLRQSDVVSLHCPLTDQTRHLIGKEQLAMMKPTAILVNTARGPIVDELALSEHLESHPEFYAGLDVYEKEPKITDSLLRLPNAVCLPHIGSGDRATRESMAKICIEEAIRFAKGETLRYEYGVGKAKK